MSLVAIVRGLPEELQIPMLEFAEAIEEDLRARLAVRSENIEAVQATLQQLAESQNRSEIRLDRLEAVVAELAEAQVRTEQRVAELAEAQKRTEKRLDRLEIAVAELAEAQKRTEKRLDRLEIVVAELTEAQKRTERRVEELAEAQKRTERRVEELAEAQKRTEETLNKLIVRVDRIEVKLGGLVGDNLERRYRERAFSYLGQILRPVRHVPLQDILPQMEAHLSESEIDELLPLDILLNGRVKQIATRPEIWLAMEVSAVVDRGDVDRAVKRASLLAKAGMKTLPAVAGEDATEGANLLAAEQKVLLLQNGRRLNWQEALDEMFAREEI